MVLVFIDTTYIQLVYWELTRYIKRLSCTRAIFSSRDINSSCTGFVYPFITLVSIVLEAFSLLLSSSYTRWIASAEAVPLLRLQDWYANSGDGAINVRRRETNREIIVGPFAAQVATVLLCLTTPYSWSSRPFCYTNLSSPSPSQAPHVPFHHWGCPANLQMETAGFFFFSSV